MDDDGARRLIVASALRLHATRRLGTVLPGDADLTDAARRLGEGTGRLARVHGLGFSPAYPGVGAGVEEIDTEIGTVCRLVLACRADDRHGPGAGTAFTTLIAGRAPQVSVAPSGTPVPEHWSDPGTR